MSTVPHATATPKQPSPPTRVNRRPPRRGPPAASPRPPCRGRCERCPRRLTGCTRRAPQGADRPARKLRSAATWGMAGSVLLLAYALLRVAAAFGVAAALNPLALGPWSHS